MTIGALVEHVSETLSRAHHLFGDEAAPTGTGLATIRPPNERPQARASSLSGHLAERYAHVDARLESRLDALAGTDAQLTAAVHGADAVRRAGRADSGRVVAAAADDVTRTAPTAGHRALLRALRNRVLQQQRVVAAYQARASEMATLMRSLAYGGTASPVTAGWGLPAGGGPRTGTGSPTTSTGGLILASRTHPDRGSAPNGLTMHSSPRDCAVVLIDQARRRGYSPDRIVAMLSTMLQESGGHPDSVSPNGLWHGLFQQDVSYPGRDDPGVAITAFLNRLSAKGGQDAPDVWKTIFWLQQAPGAATAEAAYDGGRHDYLREIQSQLSRARALYREVTGS